MLECFLLLLSPVGLPLTTFGHFRPLWPLLATFGHIWPHLATFGPFWLGPAAWNAGWVCWRWAPVSVGRRRFDPPSTNVHSPTTHPLSNPPAVTTDKVPETRYLAKVSTPLLLFFTELVELQTGETSDSSGTPALKWKRCTSIPFPHRSLRNSETETASQVLRVIAACNGLLFMLDPDHQRDHHTRQ